MAAAGGSRQLWSSTSQIISSLLLSFVLCMLLNSCQLSAHVLECYQCASMPDHTGDKIVSDLKKHPCWDPISNKMKAITCPHGTSCYKQETILYDIREGEYEFAEKYYAVSRFCGTKRFADQCSQTAGPNSVSTTCACTGNLCNSAMNNRVKSAALIYTVTATLLSLALVIL